MKQLFLLSFLLPTILLAQIDRKNLNALKISDAPKIDGILNESFWASAEIAKDFVMFEPGNGEAEQASMNTEVKIAYNDQAIYISAVLKDRSPDSILTQLTARDDFNQNTDWFGIFLNPYNDGLNDFNFWVTAAGVQADARTTQDGDDFSWNAVWKSAVQLTDKGWVVEMEIPYMALRFPENQVEEWGLNMLRSIRRNRHQYSWNFLDKNSGYRLEYQCGLLKNIENIDPPIRLSLMPYVSTYVNSFDGQSQFDFNAGMDLKYGISQGFTLDMTLIPDFGQVAFDQQVLNLTPFENRFDENRQFFTEGTELFSIGDLFYSRRIGGVPKNITGNSVQDTNFIRTGQDFTRLLNATKVSGRTNGNLGVGVLNAVTANSFTSFQDPDSGEEIEVLSEPLTNYNVLVLDQRFNRNSSVSLVNTNVLRNGPSPDANVTGLLSELYNPNGKYRLNLSFKMSNIFDTVLSTGYENGFSFADVDGAWQWSWATFVATDDYDINDLGFQQRNNYLNHNASLVWQTFVPDDLFNKRRFSINMEHRSLYETNRFEEFSLNMQQFVLLKDFTALRVNFNAVPVESFNYFEPRREGSYFAIPASYGFGGFISSDYRKVFAVDANIDFSQIPDFETNYYNFSFRPRIRLGDRLFMTPRIEYRLTDNEWGYASNDVDLTYFGQRDIDEWTNAIEARYVFNPFASLNLSLRHLWVQVDYSQFGELQTDGTIKTINEIKSPNINFNTLNIDIRFSWWFAPGSELVFLYRNVISTSADIVDINYWDNINSVINSPMRNNVSLRMTYFLDYNSIRRKHKYDKGPTNN